MTGADTTHPVHDVLSRLEGFSDQRKVTLKRLFEAFGATSFVPALMVPALLVVSPLSGIPFFSSFCGLSIALIALQMIFARKHLWLPAFLHSRTVRGDKLERGLRRLHRVADFLDRHARDRWRFLVTTPGNRLPQAMCLVSGLSMPFLELIPFSSSILGMAVLSCAVALLARDGFFVIVGALFMGIAAAVPLFVWNTVAGP